MESCVGLRTLSLSVSLLLVYNSHAIWCSMCSTFVILARSLRRPGRRRRCRLVAATAAGVRVGCSRDLRRTL